MANTVGLVFLILFSAANAIAVNGVALEGNVSEVGSLLPQHQPKVECGCIGTSTVLDPVTITPRPYSATLSGPLVPTVETVTPSPVITQPADVTVTPSSIETQPPDVTATPPPGTLTPSLETVFPDPITLCICGKQDHEPDAFGGGGHDCSNTIATPDAVTVTPPPVTAYPTEEVVTPPLVTVIPSAETRTPPEVTIELSPVQVTPSPYQATFVTTIQLSDELVNPPPYFYTFCTPVPPKDLFYKPNTKADECGCEYATIFPPAVSVVPDGIEITTTATFTPTVETVAPPAQIVTQPPDVTVTPAPLETQLPDVTVTPSLVTVTPTLETATPDPITLCICGDHGHGHGSHGDQPFAAGGGSSCTNTIITPNPVTVTPPLQTWTPTEEVVSQTVFTVQPTDEVITPDFITVVPTPELVTPGLIYVPITINLQPLQETASPHPISLETCVGEGFKADAASMVSA